ncbi:putative F-box domain, FBD domain, leucine-rich repeat domain superfamily [Helianthus annuus]|uniref:F-box domain, FBD domain, leucine-rich repeat domain superfamily n=2 Tax=Helianthus annuus TaxID=4232 RepID=A0A9K3DM54_HELAN|nr:F-box/FBD/LRR-repeat protein At4g00160 [Helianthus annuus]KAF5757159.1 putative F-box domain, FBD domain, leucine-rich repeat domain superfamily [Helianthus annuus]
MSSISEDVDDRLSGLPEEIHSHILSLMPTKYAVRTSILSKRWRYSWMFVTNLDFDDIHIDPIHIVDRALESYQMSKVELFRVHFSKIRAPESKVSSWIDWAVRLNVRELDIHVIRLELPLSLLTCKTLTKLSIGLSGRRYNVLGPQSPVNLPCLKTLDIVLWKTPFLIAFNLIHGCPVIEDLSLEVKDCGDEKLFKYNIPTLKRLKLTYAYVINDVKNTVVLNVPNLEYLFVGGVLYSSFVMEDLSSLIEASVSIRETTDCSLLVDLLKGISGVQSLSLQYFPHRQRLPVFSNTKHLELKDLWEPKLIPKLLDRFPRLQHLCIEKPKECLWRDPKWVPACIRTSLTTLKFSKCNGRKYDMELLKYLLRNAEVLKTVTITWEDLHKEEKRRFAAQMHNFLRAF